METTGSSISQQEASSEYCYGHPKTPTRLHCSRCDRPICDRCAIPAVVGQHCPECVAEARRSTPKVRTVMAARAPVTLALIVINVVFYVAQQLVPGFTGHFYAFTPAIANGQWYRLFTSMFLHAGIMHIAFNMLALFYLGPMAEDIIGRTRFAIGYLVAGLFASAVSYLIAPIFSPSLGASGAIFGVFALVMVLAYNRRSDPGANAILRNLMGLLVINALLFFFIANIDIWAHIGGFIGGAILGFAFDRPHSAGKWSVAGGVAPLLLLALTVAIVIVRTSALTG